MRVLFFLLGSCALVFGLPLFDEIPEGAPEPRKASDIIEIEPIPIAIFKDEDAPEPRIGLDQAVPEFKIEKPAADSPVGLPHIYLDAPEIHSSNGPQKDYYQGDIALTEEQRHGTSLKRRKRQGYKDSSFPNTLWQVGTPIGYTIDSSLPARTAGLIRQALAYWSNHTCLTFQENGSGGSTKMVFFAGSGCWSYIGKVWYWGTQNISIGSECQTQFGMISHEIGHALGLFHAQSRYDRDDFVTVQTQHITADGQGQFSKESTSTNDNFGVKYDYGSVMHYSDVAFSNSPGDVSKKTITAKEPYYQRTMGGRIAPAFSDVKVINSLYNCTNQCGTLACQNGGYANPSNCNTCLCPWGFAGALCDQRQEGTNGTCGQTLTATTSWQSLTKWVGKNDTVMYDTFNSCYWHIKSAVGTKVQIKVEFVGLVCSGGCFYGAVEFKMGEFTRTGNRFCCPEDYTGTPTLTSTSNLAVIGLHARYNLMYFVIQYKQV